MIDNIDKEIEKISSEISEDMILFAQKIIQTKSLTGQEQDIALIVEDKMKELGFKVTVDKIGRASCRERV